MRAVAHATRTAGIAGAEGLQRVVLRLQPDVVGLAEEGLDRRLLAHEGDDDLQEDSEEFHRVREGLRARG